MDEKAFKTISDLLEQPAGECVDVLAEVAPAIERVANRSGLLDMMVAAQGTANDEAEAEKMVKAFISALLKHALGDCNGDVLTIIAAVNGITVEELRSDYSGWQLVRMVKAIITDKGFFTSLRALLA